MFLKSIAFKQSRMISLLLYKRKVNVMRKITKNIFLSYLKCKRLAGMLRSQEKSYKKELSLAEQFRMEQGLEVGQKSREIYPEGVLVEEKNSNDSIEKTKKLIDAKAPILFEATFSSNNLIAKADILVKVDNGWHLIEVKSSVNERDEQKDDLAYTTLVLMLSEIKVVKSSLLLISKDYRLGMSVGALFKEIDISKEVFGRVVIFRELCKEIDENTTESKLPKAELLQECKKCSIFNSCFDIEHPIFEIPRLSKKKFDELKLQNIFSIKNIDKEFPLTNNQLIVRNSVVSSQSIIQSNLPGLLKVVMWPAFYLDFESVATAIPLYESIAPFEVIPTQFSIHKVSKDGLVKEHFEFLADHRKDCRKDMALKLINDLAGNGSILMYSSYEKTVVNNLAKNFPEFSDELNQLIVRMLDLKDILSKGYYNPEFHGSFSIKDTLPVLVEDMSYKALNIQDGESAIAVFAFLAKGKYSDEEAIKLRDSLLHYCKQDTLAMVKIHEKLKNFVK